jgi:hypothetical protein
VKPVGRNHTCPCGSGKKYKKCHGNDDGPAQGSIPQKRLTANISFPPLTGLCGLQQWIIIVPKYADPTDPRNAWDPQGRPGGYDVVFTLSRPGYPLTAEHNLSASAHLQGDSHLAITRPANILADPSAAKITFDIDFNGAPFQFDGSPNKQGFLSKISGRVFAPTSRDAYKIALSAITPSLSNISAQLDIPLFIFQADITEVTSSIHSIIGMIPFQNTPFVHLPGNMLSPDVRAYTALYRESLNSNSPIYQFLCLYKILESIRKRRSRLAQAARSSEQPFSRPQERFPGTAEELKPWLDALYPVRPPSWGDRLIAELLLPEVAGRKFAFILDTHLAPIRVNIAHAVFETGELALSADDALSHETVYRWLPILKCLVRRMLKNEFPEYFLTALGDCEERLSPVQ